MKKVEIIVNAQDQHSICSRIVSFSIGLNFGKQPLQSLLLRFFANCIDLLVAFRIWRSIYGPLGCLCAKTYAILLQLKF